MSTARHSPRFPRVPVYMVVPRSLPPWPLPRRRSLLSSSRFFLSFPFSPPIVSLLCFPWPLSFSLFFSLLPIYSLCLSLSSVLSPLIVLERIHHDCPVNHAANRSPWRRYPPTNEDLFRLVETRENTDMGMSVRSRVMSIVKIAKWSRPRFQPALPQIRHSDKKDVFDLILRSAAFPALDRPLKSLRTNLGYR